MTVAVGFLKSAFNLTNGTTAVNPRRRLAEAQRSKVGNGGKILHTRAHPVPAVAPLKKTSKVTGR